MTKKTTQKKIRLVQRLDFIKQVCKGKKVLHLGCTNYPYTREAIEKNALLHLQLREHAAQLYGMDYDREGLEILKKYGVENLYQGDLEDLSALELDETFEVIIAGEMIEHLNNPGLFLEGVKRLMDADSRLVITTINAFCGLRFFYYFLRGRSGVNEPVHPDHVAYYSYSTLSLLLRRHNLAVEEFLFYDLGEEHRKGKWYFNFINDVSVKFTPQLADGLIAVCRLENK
jgi:2-polyprenyl-3-methyl-5-hydroxy-6-metoxy-1,4-benzoquinol methylase